jgi:hypothetical protein
MFLRNIKQDKVPLISNKKLIIISCLLLLILCLGLLLLKIPLTGFSSLSVQNFGLPVEPSLFAGGFEWENSMQITVNSSQPIVTVHLIFGNHAPRNCRGNIYVEARGGNAIDFNTSNEINKNGLCTETDVIFDNIIYKEKPSLGISENQTAQQSIAYNIFYGKIIAAAPAEVEKQPIFKAQPNYGIEAGTRYWVGGTGSWSNDTGHWATSSGGAPGAGNKPTVNEAVVFDNNSGGGTATLDETGYAASIDVGTVTNSNTILALGAQTINVVGDFKWKSLNMSFGTSTVNLTGNGTLTAPAYNGADRMYNLRCAASGQTTTLAASATYIGIQGNTGLVTGSGTLTATGVSLGVWGAWAYSNTAGTTFSGTGNYFNIQSSVYSFAFGNIGTWNILFSGSSISWTLTGSLTTTGNLILGNYAVNGNSLNLNGQTVSVGTLQAGQNGKFDNMTFGAATVTATSFTINANATANLNSSTTTVSGATSITGTLTPSTSVITLNGATTVNSGGTLGANSAYTLDLNNDLTIATNGTLSAPNSTGTFNFSGANWWNGGTFTTNSGTANFDKAGATNLFRTAAVGNSFYNVYIASGTTLTRKYYNSTYNNPGFEINNIITVAGAMSNGDAWGYATIYTLTPTIPIVLTGAGTWDDSTIYNGAGAQNVSGIDYGYANNRILYLSANGVTPTRTFMGNVRCGNALFSSYGSYTYTIDLNNYNLTAKSLNVGTLATENPTVTPGTGRIEINGTTTITRGTLGGNTAYTLDLNDNLTIGSAGTLNASNSTGTFNFSGATLSNSGTFTHDSGTITFDRAGAQALTGTTTFYNVNIVSGTTANLTSATQITTAGTTTLSGALQITNGTWTNLTLNDGKNTLQTIQGSNVQVSNVGTSPIDPTGYTNMSKYSNITNLTTTSWAYLNISYNASMVGLARNESTIKFYNSNGTNWYNISGSTVDTTNKYAYGNITNFTGNTVAVLIDQPQYVVLVMFQIHGEEGVEATIQGGNWDDFYNNYTKNIYNATVSYTSSSSSVANLMNSTYRNSVKDSFGNDYKITWMPITYGPLEFDTNVLNDGVPTNIITYYDALTSNWASNISYYNDSIEWHPHLIHYDDVDNNSHNSWNQIPSSFYPSFNATYQAIAEEVLNHYLIDRNFWPSTLTAGWVGETADYSNWLEQWIPFDASNAAPIVNVPTTDPRSNDYNWSIASSNFSVYHPSSTNYQISGNMNRTIAEVQPGCPLTATSVNKAFNTSMYGQNDSFISCYFHVGDSFTPFTDYVNSTLPVLQNASNVYGLKFQFVNAKEGFQDALGYTDTTPPVLNITRNGDIMSINSSESLFQSQPYAAVKFVNGTYARLNLTVNGSSWYYNISGVTSSFNMTVGANDKYGNPGTANIWENIYNNNIVWTGATDTNWSVATNWNTGTVPISSDAVTLNATAANQPIVYTGSTANASSLTIPANANLTLQGTASMTIASTVIINGTIIPNTATVILNGTTTVNSGGTLGGNSAYILDVNGLLTLNSGGILNAPNNTGTFTISNNFLLEGTFNHDNGTITFDGSSDKSFGADGAVTPTFNNVAATMGGVYYFLRIRFASFTILNNLTISHGTSVNIQAYTYSASQRNTILTMGTASNSGNIPGATSYTIFQGDTSTAGSVTVQAASASYPILISGVGSGASMSGSNTYTMKDVTFTSAQTTAGTITLAGTATFNGALTIPSGSTLGSNSAYTLDVNAPLTTNSGGTLNAPNSTGQFKFSGDTLGNSGTFNHDSGTIVFDKAGITTLQTAFTNASGITISPMATLNTNATGNYALTAAGAALIQGILTPNTATITLNGATTVTLGGTFGANTAYTLDLNNNLILNSPGYFFAPNSTGTFTFSGATLGIAGIFYHDFGTIIFDRGGTTTLQTAFTNASGITINSGATLNTNLTGNYALTAAGATSITGLLTPNTATITLNGITTINSGGGLGANTGYKLDVNNNLTISSGGALSAPSALGTFNFSGATFTPTGTFTANSGLMQFDRAGTTTLGANTLTFYTVSVLSGCTFNSSNYNVTVTGTNTTPGTFTVNSGATVNFGTSTVSISSGNTGGRSFDCNGGTCNFANATVTAGGQFEMASNSVVTLPSNTLTLNGAYTGNANLAFSWSSNLTLNHNSGTVIFSYAGSQILYAGDNVAKTFYNLRLNGTNTVVQPYNGKGFNITVAGNLTITLGTLRTYETTSSTPRSLTVTGTTSIARTLDPGTSIITFNGATTINSSGTLGANTSYTLDVNAPLTVSSSGTLSAPNATGSWTQSGNLTLASNSIITHNSGNLTFDGSANYADASTTSPRLNNVVVNTGVTVTLTGTGYHYMRTLNVAGTGVLNKNGKSMYIITASSIPPITVSDANRITGTGTLYVSGSVNYTIPALNLTGGIFDMGAEAAAYTVNIGLNGSISNNGLIGIYPQYNNPINFNSNNYNITATGNTIQISSDSGDALITANLGTSILNSTAFVLGTLTSSTVAYTTGTIYTAGNANIYGNLTPLGAATLTFNGATTINSTGTLGANITYTLDLNNNLTVISGGVLSAPDATGTFNFGGSTWNNTGTFTPNSGTVIFDKGTGQTLSGTLNFYNANVTGGSQLSNTAGVKTSLANQIAFVNGQWSNLQLDDGVNTQVNINAMNANMYDVASVPSDPQNSANITKYVNLTGGSWANISILYNDSNIPAGYNESTLRLARYNGTWITNPLNFASSYSVDTINNIIYANITDFGSIFAPLGKSTPDAPTLLSPAAGALISTTRTPTLNFTIPGDVDNDTLHFEVWVSDQPDFSTTIEFGNSSANATPFTPTPPVLQNSGNMSYQTSTKLNATIYYWEVRAFDGFSYSSYSSTFNFTIDSIILGCNLGTANVTFGEVQIGTTNAATGNTLGAGGGTIYNVTADASIATNVTIKGTNMTCQSGGCGANIIPVGQTKWSSSESSATDGAMCYANSYAMQETDDNVHKIADFLPQDATAWERYWLDVPPAQPPGTYNGNYTITCVAA